MAVGGIETQGIAAVNNSFLGGYGAVRKTKIEEGLDFKAIIDQHIDEMSDKIKRGDIQQKFAIGSQEFTLEEWDKLLNQFDEAEKAIIEEVEAQAQEALEAREDLENDITRTA